LIVVDDPNSPVQLEVACSADAVADSEGLKTDPEVKLPKDREPSCEEIKARMDWVMRDLEKRYAEQLAGRPPGALYPAGTIHKGKDVSGKDVWLGHDEQITGRKNELRKLTNRYRSKTADRGPCEDPPDDPGLSKKLNAVQRPNPTAADWEKQNGTTVEDWLKGHPNSVKAAAALGAGYIIYRVIRFLPSLFPPLWPTIPENVAIP
jgi:hypothetical protein